MEVPISSPATSLSHSDNGSTLQVTGQRARINLLKPRLVHQTGLNRPPL